MSFLFFYRINANVDLIVNGVELLKALKISPTNRAKDHEYVSSLEELQEVFGHFLAAGAAAERAFTDAKLFKEIVDTASELKSAEVICYKAQ